MRKFTIIVKSLLLALLLCVTLINLSQVVQAYNRYGDCGSLSEICDMEVESECIRKCSDRGGCDNWYFDFGICQHGLCYQFWTYECVDGWYDYYTCIAPEIYCPLK